MSITDTIILRFCLAVLVVAVYFDKKWTPKIVAYDRDKSFLIADKMTALLSWLFNQLGIYRPIDVLSVWHDPIQRDGVWIYRVKATMLPNALTDYASMKDQAALINRRAKDIGLPIRVTDVYIQGLFFIYEVEIIDS